MFTHSITNTNTRIIQHKFARTLTILDKLPKAISTVASFLSMLTPHVHGCLRDRWGLEFSAPVCYFAAYQLWAHFASTARSTWRSFLPQKGLDMHSTTMDFASSADSAGPSSITSSCTWLEYIVSNFCTVLNRRTHFHYNYWAKQITKKTKKTLRQNKFRDMKNGIIRQKGPKLYRFSRWNSESKMVNFFYLWWVVLERDTTETSILQSKKEKKRSRWPA